MICGGSIQRIEYTSCVNISDVSFVNANVIVVIVGVAAGVDIPSCDSGSCGTDDIAAISSCKVGVVAAVVTVGIVVSAA
ncbi:Hypothetical predicted protein [Octopus vulgaris]|uniref:Uncharacterized protein n=1 Tax=Octopus vulgaris TaxID=6645 RepID=A0AA36B848_OCTVU|nr:Hypothetical predicted protein [Octopus vulgaris]